MTTSGRRKTPPDTEVADILAQIALEADQTRRSCSVGRAVQALPAAAQEAFKIALRADQDQYPHVAIARKLQELSGIKLGKDSVPKHRKGMEGKPGGCACERD